MTDRWRRAAWAAWARVSRRGERNRRALYGGISGLRILTFHDTPSRDLPRFRRLVEWCQARHEIAGPEAAVALTEGRYDSSPRDRVMFTFDDGVADNYEAAAYLHERRIRAIFFVIPSLLGRTAAQFHEYHRGRGVEAFRIREDPTVAGLSRSQVTEMSAMGHMIAGHNFAHRDLGTLRGQDDLEYEIGRALETLSEILGHPCEDFAFGFGHPVHLSMEASAYLNRNCRRVYACVRGLNVPGRTPRYLLRDHVDLSFPLGFVRSCLDGALDDRAQREWRELMQMSGRLPGNPSDVRT